MSVSTCLWPMYFISTNSPVSLLVGTSVSLPSSKQALHTYKEETRGISEYDEYTTISDLSQDKHEKVL